MVPPPRAEDQRRDHGNDPLRPLCTRPSPLLSCLPACFNHPAMTFFRSWAVGSAAALLLVCSAAADTSAIVAVEQPWARATVPGQGGTGAYMVLRAAQQGMKLIGVSTPVAGVAEIHTMRLEGNTMRMHAIPQLDLPAQHPVALAPGGHHLMLMDLKQALPAGSHIPVTLRLQDAQGKLREQTLQVPVRAEPPAGSPAANGAHHGH